MKKTLNIIACCDNKMGIGIDNKLPWNIPSEMKLFREKTTGNGNNCVITGKNTYLSIPEKHRPLSRRHNCIVSRTYHQPQQDSSGTNYTIIRNLNEELLTFLNETNYENYWIIGGSSIYYEIMSFYSYLVNEVHISILDDDYKCNKYFPNICKTQFILKEKNQNEKDKYTHYVYRNNLL
tara:strand:- start:164 stop:700 length:537 start_codon:yes stop_codon:yes gene_type:complete